MQQNASTYASLSWADIEDSQNVSSIPPNNLKSSNILNYSTIVKGAIPRVPTIPMVPKEPTEPTKKSKTSKRQCYTCKPRGKVYKHIIKGTIGSNVIFHFDLHKRPLILATPKKHYESLYEMPNNEVLELLQSTKSFCEFWKIKDYQVSFNNGNWQTHSHFHLKIKANEKILNRMRRDHFSMQKLNKNYTEPLRDQPKVAPAKCGKFLP